MSMHKLVRAFLLNSKNGLATRRLKQPWPGLERLEGRTLFSGAALGGDANRDAVVDVADVGILSTNFGTASGATWATGDFNGDGRVDVADLGILASNFNHSLPKVVGVAAVGDTRVRVTYDRPMSESALVASNYALVDPTGQPL